MQTLTDTTTTPDQLPQVHAPRNAGIPLDLEWVMADLSHSAARRNLARTQVCEKGLSSRVAVQSDQCDGSDNAVWRRHHKPG